jgi:hypothetical protein
VVAFAATTSQYATLIRRTRWRDAGITAYLVTVAGAGHGALKKVPQRLGEAFSMFWNAHDRPYPPGIVVENLS